MARILAVDDDPLSRLVLIDALRGLGHEAVAAASGREALEKMAAAEFALVISDVVMPGMDGLELIRQIQILDRPVPVMLISVAAQEEVLTPQRLAELRLAGYLTKPLDTDRLGKLVDNALGTEPPEAKGDDWEGIDFLRRVSGPLERFPPARVLFLAHRVEASGALRLSFGDRRPVIGVRGGAVMHVADVPGLLRPLDPRFPEYGDLASAVSAAVVEGHSPERAMEAAAESLGEFLARMVIVRGGNVRFDTTWTVPQGSFPLPVSIPRLLAVGLRRARTPSAVSRGWEALEAAAVRPRVPTDSPEARWGLDTTAVRALRLATRARNLGDLISKAGGDDAARRLDVLRAVDLLYLLGLVVVDGGPLDSMREPTAPRPEPTQEDPRLRRLRAALGSMEGAHALDILELGDRKTLTEVDVADAYREISRRYHPDTFFGSPPVVRGLAEACFSQVNQAYESLRLPQGLAEARGVLDARARGIPYVSERDTMSARLAFRRGETLWRNRDWKGADSLFAEAHRLDSRAWPHALYHVWCGWHARRLSATEALAQLGNIRPAEPQRIAEVLVVMGNILKADGRPEEALSRYRAALTKNPENRDAQRELRLHESRTAAAAAAKAPPPGFLSNLLNRKK